MFIFKAKEYQSEKLPIFDRQPKEHKNNKITPKNVSQKGLQSLTDVLQHPVLILYLYSTSMFKTSKWSGMMT